MREIIGEYGRSIAAGVATLSILIAVSALLSDSELGIFRQFIIDVGNACL